MLCISESVLPSFRHQSQCGTCDSISSIFSQTNQRTLIIDYHFSSGSFSRRLFYGFSTNFSTILYFYISFLHFAFTLLYQPQRSFQRSPSYKSHRVQQCRSNGFSYFPGVPLVDGLIGGLKIERKQKTL